MSVRVVSATFRVVTPLFLGGAEPTKDCELRPSSIKGALAFWWRALRADLPLAALRGEEAALFGSSEEGQSRWLLDARPDMLVHGRRLELDEGRGYLAGQGLARLPKASQQPKPQRRFAGVSPAQPKPFESSRPYLRPGGRVLLRAFRREPSPEGAAEAKGIRDALLALGTFGGLGSRSRRGFGSFHLEEVTTNGGAERSRETIVAPADLRGWKTRVSSFLAGASHPGFPKYSAFSQSARVLVLEAPSTTAEDLHEELGRSFRSFRSHERSGGVGEADHDDVAAWLQTGKLAAPPRRAVFGMPHNYYFSSSGTKVGVDPAGKSNRRASPLFIHLDEIGEGADRHAVAVLTFLPAVFLPAGEQMVVKGGGRSIRLSTRASPALWQPIRDWLDELKTNPPCSATTWER